MNRIPTSDDVIKIIAEEISIEPDKIHPSANLSELGVDSLTVMEVLFIIEERFSIQIEIGEHAQFTTFGELLEDLHRQLNLAASSPTLV